MARRLRAGCTAVIATVRWLGVCAIATVGCVRARLSIPLYARCATRMAGLLRAGCTSVVCRQTSLVVPVTRFALSDLFVLLGGDPDMRGVWALRIPFLPSLFSRRDLVTNSRDCR